MNLTVKGKNIDVGDSLRSHIAENLERMFEKYFSNPIEASVTLSKQAHIFTAQLSVHVGRGILLQSEAGADQAYAALLEGKTILDLADFTEADLTAGRFDGAEVQAYLVNWAAPQDFLLQFRGSLGEISRADGSFKAELRGVTDP